MTDTTDTRQAFATYREAERQQYFNGTWYVVRHSDAPHTTWPDGSLSYSGRLGMVPPARELQRVSRAAL